MSSANFWLGEHEWNSTNRLGEAGALFSRTLSFDLQMAIPKRCRVVPLKQPQMYGISSIFNYDVHKYVSLAGAASARLLVPQFVNHGEEISDSVFSYWLEPLPTNHNVLRIQAVNDILSCALGTTIYIAPDVFNARKVALEKGIDDLSELIDSISTDASNVCRIIDSNLDRVFTYGQVPSFSAQGGNQTRASVEAMIESATKATEAVSLDVGFHMASDRYYEFLATNYSTMFLLRNLGTVVTGGLGDPSRINDHIIASCKRNNHSYINFCADMDGFVTFLYSIPAFIAVANSINRQENHEKKITEAYAAFVGVISMLMQGENTRVEGCLSRSPASRLLACIEQAGHDPKCLYSSIVCRELESICDEISPEMFSSLMDKLFAQEHMMPQRDSTTHTPVSEMAPMVEDSTELEPLYALWEEKNFEAVYKFFCMLFFNHPMVTVDTIVDYKRFDPIMAGEIPRTMRVVALESILRYVSDKTLLVMFGGHSGMVTLLKKLSTRLDKPIRADDLYYLLNPVVLEGTYSGNGSVSDFLSGL